MAQQFLHKEIKSLFHQYFEKGDFNSPFMLYKRVDKIRPIHSYLYHEDERSKCFKRSHLQIIHSICFTGQTVLSLPKLWILSFANHCTGKFVRRKREKFFKN